MNIPSYKPGIYYAMTFVTTYAFWLSGAYVRAHEELTGLYLLFMIPGLLAPLAISVGMILGSGSPIIRRDNLNRLLNVRLIRVSSLPTLVLLMPMVVLASTLLSLLAGEPVSQLQLARGFSFSYVGVPVLVVVVLAAVVGELGWRSYAFDSLQSRFNSFGASLVFSILWSLWHLPLIVVEGSYQYEIFRRSPWLALNFFAGIVPLGIIISWFFLRNGKSIIAAILFHLAVDISQELWAITQVTKIIETGVLTVVAAIIVATDRELFFQDWPVLSPPSERSIVQ